MNIHAFVVAGLLIASACSLDSGITSTTRFAGSDPGDQASIELAVATNSQIKGKAVPIGTPRPVIGRNIPISAPVKAPYKEVANCTVIGCTAAGGIANSIGSSLECEFTSMRESGDRLFKPYFKDPAQKKENGDYVFADPATKAAEVIEVGAKLEKMASNACKAKGSTFTTLKREPYFTDKPLTPYSLRLDCVHSCTPSRQGQVADRFPQDYPEAKVDLETGPISDAIVACRDLVNAKRKEFPLLAPPTTQTTSGACKDSKDKQCLTVSCLVSPIAGRQDINTKSSAYEEACKKLGGVLQPNSLLCILKATEIPLP